jgi:nucleoside-diphosphate-sugar epimerase
VVELIEKILNKKVAATWSSYKSNQSEPKKWVADISKANNLLNWKPQNTLKEGLEKYIQYCEKK